MDTEVSDQIRAYFETAAPTISLAELAERRTSASKPGRRASGRRRGVQRRVAAWTLAATVAAGAAAIGVTESGSSPPQSTHSAGPAVNRASNVWLTAAMVHRMAKASNAALATAGHVFVTFTLERLGPREGSGTIDITFSGHDFNSAAWMPSPSGHDIVTTRLVNGQLYLFARLPHGHRPQWYHYSRQLSPGRAVPDPRQLLKTLQPEAAFNAIRSQVIGGVQTEHLRATQAGDLPATLLSSVAFVSFMDPQKLTALDVWVDRHNVVRQMRMRFSGPSPQGRLVEVQTIRFLDIGKPETITAPVHYVNLGLHR